FGGWHSKAKLFADLQPGDHLWMVTSGNNLGHEATQAGFLVAIWTVHAVIENPGDDAKYPRADYRFRIVPDPIESLAFKEPVPVDHLLRPEGQDKAAPIG